MRSTVVLTIGDAFEELTERDSAEDRYDVLPNMIAVEVGDQVEDGQGELSGIVGPRQVQNAGIVFFPVTEVERNEDGPEDEEHANRRVAEFATAEHRVDRERQEERCPRVETVIHELTKWTAGAGASGLFACKIFVRVCVWWVGFAILICGWVYWIEFAILF